MRWLVLGAAAVAVVAAIGVTLLGSSGDGAVRIPYGDRAAVEEGRAVYLEACASCHGAKLEGQTNWRQRLPNGRLPAPPHDASGHTWHHPDQQLFEITKYGVEKFAPPGYESDMPGFADQLSDGQILASLAFIKSTWPEDVQRRHDALNGSAQ